MDVAPFRVARWLEPNRHPRIPSGVAVATALYQARNTSLTLASTQRLTLTSIQTLSLSLSLTLTLSLSRRP